MRNCITKNNSVSNSEGEIISLVGPIENLQLPNPALKQFYEDLDNRIVWIDSELEDSNTIAVSKNILKWNREDANIPIEERKPIKILIFSPGGELYPTLGLIDTMLLSKTPIYTYNMGMAMSGGLLLLLAGSKRYALPRSSVLIHSGSSGQGGTYEQIEAQTEAYKKLMKIVKEYIIDRTKIDSKVYKKFSSKEWYLYAEEQVKYGIIDEIVEDLGVLI